MKLLPKKSGSPLRKPLKRKPALPSRGALKVPTPKGVDPLKRLLHEASFINGDSEVSAIKDFILVALDTANALRSNSDRWIDFCQHEQWHSERQRPKPTSNTELTDWVYRFAKPDVPIRRHGTLMHALKVLFDAGYSRANAKKLLVRHDVTEIAGLDQASKSQQGMELLRSRLVLLRTAKQRHLTERLPFLVLRLNAEHRKAVDELLLQDCRSSKFCLELSIDDTASGRAFRIERIKPAVEGGVR